MQQQKHIPHNTKHLQNVSKPLQIFRHTSVANPKMIQFTFTQTDVQVRTVACTRNCTHTASPSRPWVLQTSFPAMWAPTTCSPLLRQNRGCSCTCTRATPAAHRPMRQWGNHPQGPTGTARRGVTPLCPPRWWPTVGCRCLAAPRSNAALLVPAALRVTLLQTTFLV